MKRLSPILPLVFFAFAACSTCGLQMRTPSAYNQVPNEAQCWLSDLEDICISLSEGKSYLDGEQFEEDVRRGAMLLQELEEEEGWASRLTPEESESIKEVALKMVIHYGVQGLLEM
ncbi:MAG: hypothetical protein CL946_09540 [Ectothiorhodospiraceae bacterium]|nr:hypothetical protein [Ectothiorhodospiraceae bacterium]